MKKILAIALALLMLLSFAACGGDKGGDTTAAPDADTTEAAPADSTEAAESTDAADSTEAASEDASADIDLSGVDFSKVDLTVEDLDAMEKFQNELSEGKWTDKVVKIKGYDSYFNHHSIMIKDADGAGHGVAYELVGSDEYPEEKTEITITGVVKTEGWTSTIYVPADQLVVG